MSSVNRVLRKRREAQPTEKQEGGSVSVSQQGPPPPQVEIYSEEKENKYEEYAEYWQYNPSSFEFSNTHLPFSLNLYNRYKAPLSCYINPINQDLEYTPQSGGSIPRCSSCRAYMNYYNEVTRKGYKCFFCGRENHYDMEYDPQGNQVELTTPNYLVDGPNNVYNAVPPEPCLVFLIDISKEAQQSRMLEYVASVMKDVLSREDMNDTLIYFYTFDESLHQYDFAGDEAERTILDPSLKAETRPPESYLGEIREKLWTVLDSLEELADKNSRQNSKFFQILGHVYDSVKHTACKIFIFHANEAMIGESFLNENHKWSTNPQDNNMKPKSLLQTKNKMFFNRFVQPMLMDNVSFSFFLFSRSPKNIRIFSDTCKLTNSELFVYSKDNEQDLTRFYYEFYHLLGATYYVDTRLQFIISAGWYYTAVYGNLYRLKEYITFKFCHFQDSKRVCAVFLPQDGFNTTPYFSIQIISHYIYKRKHYMAVNTGVVPFTTSIDRLFENMHLQITSSTFFKIYLSCLRLEDLNTTKNKYIKHAASIWKSINDHFHNVTCLLKKNVTPEIRAMILSMLGFLKNYHSQIDIINDTPIMDRVVAARNLLQSANYQEVQATFSPYLFDISSMGPERCQPQEFMYPDPCQLRFSQVKQGIFLMDAGHSLYLYLAKSYQPSHCRALFGKEKLLKTDQVDQSTIAAQGNRLSEQVMQLMRVLRESKTYGWVPLYVVRCGEHTEHEKTFYLNFHEEKYDEFKSYKLSYDEFVSMLSKQY